MFYDSNGELIEWNKSGRGRKFDARMIRVWTCMRRNRVGGGRYKQETYTRVC
jgi:hypothetical protein